MAETIADRTVCENCGSDVREGTSFCYNCGKSVVAEELAPAEEVHTSNGSAAAVSSETQAALDDLAHRLSIDETTSEENKLAQAAAERKRARVRARRSEVVWEAAADAGVNVVFVAVTLLIVVITALVVLLAVVWK